MFQAFNARALRSGPRDLTVRLPSTARAILPFTARHRAPIPPGSGGRFPTRCHLSRDKTRAGGVRAKISPRIRFWAAAVCGRDARVRRHRGFATRGTDASTRSPRVFDARSPPTPRAAPRAPRPSGAPSHPNPDTP